MRCRIGRVPLVKARLVTRQWRTLSLQATVRRSIEDDPDGFDHERSDKRREQTRALLIPADQHTNNEAQSQIINVRHKTEEARDYIVSQPHTVQVLPELNIPAYIDGDRRDIQNRVEWKAKLAVESLEKVRLYLKHLKSQPYKGPALKDTIAGQIVAELEPLSEEEKKERLAAIELQETAEKERYASEARGKLEKTRKLIEESGGTMKKPSSKTYEFGWRSSGEEDDMTVEEEEEVEPVKGSWAGLEKPKEGSDAPGAEFASLLKRSNEVAEQAMSKKS